MFSTILLLRAFGPPSKSDVVIYLCAIVGGLAWLVFRAWRERQAQSWPVVKGTVEWTWVRVEGNGQYEERIPEVCYSYSVNGEYYSGSHRIFEASFDKYPKGSPILVHYKSSDPAVSFPDLQDMQAHEEAD
jgi:Protein of unknown function (DUF3592)